MAPFSLSSPLKIKSPIKALHLSFSIKAPYSSFKLKTLFQTLILPHLHRIARPAAAKSKSLLLKVLRETQYLARFRPLKKMMMIKHKKQQTKTASKKFIVFGSFRLHYNWCSNSHVMPLGQDMISCSRSKNFNVDNDSDDSCCLQGYCQGDDGDQQMPDNELSRYLEWLERKGCNTAGQEEFNEIDKLADLFIANCHEKFRLEKQESYRRFQEMLARSV